MKEKEIFDVQALSKEAFAESLGLAAVPDLGADWEAKGVARVGMPFFCCSSSS